MNPVVLYTTSAQRRTIFPRARKLNQTSTHEIKESRCVAEGENGLSERAGVSTAGQEGIHEAEIYQLYK